MTSEQLFQLILEKGKEFGLDPRSKSEPNPKGNAVLRKNLYSSNATGAEAKDPYFGFISPREPLSGTYSDFSFVVLPDNEQDVRMCVAGLVVGSQGFVEDYELAGTPGLRRNFLTLRSLNPEATFYKTSFDDINTSLGSLQKEIPGDRRILRDTVKAYSTVIPAATIIDFDKISEQDALDIIYTWLAMYGQMREWGIRENSKARQKWLDGHIKEETVDYREKAHELLITHRFLVLQGAPGVGKTFTAAEIASDEKEWEKTFFIQFSAETTYSDFVYGITPNMNENASELTFCPKKGVLYEAIAYASNTKEKVLLIIDEINRANLANVLGPVFYLFEKDAKDRKLELNIGDMTLTHLPENLYVLATMNTADRSLAVVDFALRRRFTWFTLRPQSLQNKEVPSGKVFQDKEFNDMAEIFRTYASDEELNLQPGQSYFIVDKADPESAIKQRLQYEVMPLVKEYLNEGYMLRARDAFGYYFLQHAGVLMYQ